MRSLNAAHAIDFYKSGHIYQYPDGTQGVYSNWTPRSLRLYKGKEKKIVVYGLQGFLKWFLIDMWNETFFNKPKEEAVRKYQRRMDNALGKGAVKTDHIEALHDLGYLPLEIKGLDEGAVVGAKIPTVSVRETLREFAWLVNYIESIMSCELWKPSTVATIAREYKKILLSYASQTGVDPDFTAIQAHDFSFRGMSGLHDAASSCSGHLLSFIGTDTVPAIDYLEEYYQANCETEMIGCSVAATEHSVMCMGSQVGEIDTFKRLISQVYPSGIVSIVSDTWDFWKVITEFTVELKDLILSRERDALGMSKVVFRPDSGDPVYILTGYMEDEYTHLNGKYFLRENPEHELSEAEVKGAVQCLWEVFGGDVNTKGFKVLDEHVGLIYGDSITLERAEEILSRLKTKGFASSNVVFGIGSYTYQYNTRDSLGYAMKATYGVVNGEPREIFKDPVTDSGVKKSAKGLLRVELENGEYVLYDQQTPEQEQQGELKTRFKDGKLYNQTSLSEIRNLLAKSF